MSFAGRESEKPSQGKSTPKPASDDALALLKADHKAVAELFSEYLRGDVNEARKIELVEEICDALTIHMRIEEEIFYPAARRALADEGEAAIEEAEVEHDGIRSLVEQLKTALPGDDHFDAKVKVLSEYVSHHVREEENDLFPKVVRTSLDLDELGADLAERKAELNAETRMAVKAQ